MLQKQAWIFQVSKHLFHLFCWHVVLLVAWQNVDAHAVKSHYDEQTSFEATDFQEHESHSVTGGTVAETANRVDESTVGGPDKAAEAASPKKTRTTRKKNTENFDWDKFRRQAFADGHMKERKSERRDSVDWEAVRCADVRAISSAIRGRGINNVLAERIQVQTEQ